MKSGGDHVVIVHARHPARSIRTAVAGASRLAISSPWALKIMWDFTQRWWMVPTLGWAFRLVVSLGFGGWQLSINVSVTDRARLQAVVVDVTVQYCRAPYIGINGITGVNASEKGPISARPD